MNQQPAVLYVEDDPNSRKLMQRLLQTRMCLPHVTIFEDSNDFMDRIKLLDPAPQVVFLDIHMRPHDGFEMLAMLHEMPWVKKPSIVALTASVMNEEVRRLRNAGFDGCLAKPINISTFPELLLRIATGETIWRILEY